MLYNPSSYFYKRYLSGANQALKMETSNGPDLSIRGTLLKCLPFGAIKARGPVAIVMSFYGNNEVVTGLMQTLSHKTRAYIVNAKGLKGFLKAGLISIL